MKNGEIKSTRLGKRDYTADFRTADSDDFYGFSTSKECKPITMLAIAMTFVALLLVGWLIIGNAQQDCLANNEGNITLCE